jgi:hypothetical protein
MGIIQHGTGFFNAEDVCPICLVKGEKRWVWAWRKDNIGWDSHWQRLTERAGALIHHLFWKLKHWQPD